MPLPILWFILLGVLLAGYAILDGFDLGVGILHPLARNDHERRIFINAIGPIWDGNEVWLITFGGALFAAFPEAYATIFSGFYPYFMALLFALIFRAASIEFRSKVHSPRWRHAWDYGFFGSSLFATILFGVTVGNAMTGIPLDERGVFVGSPLDMIKPYPFLVAFLAVSLFAMHGALYLYLKVPHGELHQKMGRW
ncbi:MAG TPA: cytochrome d ubiquinol oxidase subunit II, partial [Tepidisphaeraceae bacterium]|nr:cytochrome d ubiquinol oxidase subunit II [Tepidisphaeraceae bacterium]